MRRYPEYKKSGVKWIGVVPRSWKMKRLKYVADLNMGQSPPSEEYNSDQIGTPFLQGNIDKLIAAEQQKIKLLKEYRQSLISEAVTGKIDVRNEV